jgi:hypothetical protein
MIDVGDLRCDAVACTSQPFDFGEGCGETWDLVVPNGSDLKLETLYEFLKGGGVALPDPNPWAMDFDRLAALLMAHDYDLGDDETELSLREAVVEGMDQGDIGGIEAWQDAFDDYVGRNSERFAPLMNYLWPLPDYDRTPQVDQIELDLAGIACVLVEVGAAYHLALAGGGMDLSDHLARAYILLGYLPPFDIRIDPDRAPAVVVEACYRTCEVLRAWVEHRERQLGPRPTAIVGAAHQGV